MLHKDQWIAAINRRYGPRYIAIVEALAEMIETGVLRGEEQIPTQRELANMLSLTPGTTARAYAIAAQRGLIVGETGRGTYVRRDAASPRLPRAAEYAEYVEARAGAETPQSAPGDTALLGDLAIPNVIADNLKSELQPALRLAADLLPFSLGRYHPYSAQVPLHFRETGVRWLAKFGLRVDPEQVVLTSGAHAGLYLILISENLRRLPVMSSVLTYAGLRNIAVAHDREVIPVNVDEAGLVPQSIEHACKAGGRILYVQCHVQNPICVATPLERRQEIVALARKFDLVIIEDDAAPLAFSDAIPPLAALAPERTFMISSCAKSIGPTINVGVVSVPSGWASQLNVAIKTHHIYASMFNVEVLRVLLQEGALDRITERSRSMVASRAATARDLLAPYALTTHPDSWFAWLELPNTWTSESFVTAARMQGIAVGGSENFALDGRRPDKNGVRLSLTSPASEQALTTYLQKIRALLEPLHHQARALV